jgi:hypothetical protein
MSTNIAEQVRHFAEVLEDFIIDVDVEEILARADTRPTPNRVNDQTTRRAPTAESPRRIILPAAAVTLVVGLVGALWLVADGREPAPGSQPPGSAPITTSLTTIDPETLGTVPVESLGTNAVLRVAVDTPVGRFEIYDHPGEEQTSLYLRRTDGSVVGGQFDNTTVDEGLAWSLIGGEHEGSQLAWGLAPDIDDYWVEIADRRIDPDPTGIWYATVDNSVLAFTIHRPEGQVTVGANPAPGATTTTSLATETT